MIPKEIMMLHDFKVRNYTLEVEGFVDRILKSIVDDETLCLIGYLNQLLALKTCDEIVFYYNATKTDNIVLFDFEKKMKSFDDIDTIKSYLLFCFADGLTKYNKK